MSALRRLVERRDLFSTSLLDPNRIPLNSEGYATAAGIAVTQKTSTRLSVVYACVRILSQQVASLPLHVYRKTGDLRLELPLPPYLEQPNPDFNRFEFFEQVMSSLLLWGNAYIFKVYDQNQMVSELWVSNPEWVRVSGGTANRLYNVSREGMTQTYPASDVIHIRGTSMPGSIYGMSPIDEGRQSLGLAFAAEAFGARFFMNGTMPSGVVEIPGNADENQLRLMATKWKAAQQGIARAHEPGFLTGGAVWKPISIPNDQAQFLETRKLQIAEVARWFGVPAHKIGDLERATFSNIEHQAIEFVTDGLMPWLIRIETALNPLVGPGSFPDRRTAAFLKFNVEGLLRGDSAARASYYSTMRNIGVVNADEIRAWEDLPPIPGGLGKTYWQPSNIMPAGTPPPAPISPLNGSAKPNGTTDQLARLLAAAHKESP